MSDYKLKKIRDIHRGLIFNLTENELTFPDSKKVKRELIEHPGAAAVLPFIDDKNLVLIKQFRSAAGREIWEIPAGKLEPGEDPKICAARELLEETGYRSESLEQINTILVSPGYSTEEIHIFKATNLKVDKQNLEEDERISIHILSIDEAVRLISVGEIVDAKTIVALLLLK